MTCTSLKIYYNFDLQKLVLKYFLVKKLGGIFSEVNYFKEMMSQEKIYCSLVSIRTLAFGSEVTHVN